MAWFKIDDGFLTHPKVFGIKAGPLALWMRAGLWCARELTDGRISQRALRGLEAKPGHVQELVARGLWEPIEDGYEFHDWLQYQPSREQVLRDRQATRARVERFREKKATRPRLETSSESDDFLNVESEENRDVSANCNGVSNAGVTPAPVPVPVPVPVREEILTRTLLPRTDTSVPTAAPPSGEGGIVPIEPVRKLEIEGFKWLESVLGTTPPDLGSWRQQYAQIAGKPAAERAAVARHALATGYIREKRSKATPGHLLKFWAQFVEGPRSFEFAGPTTAKRFAGPSRVATAEEYAADAAGGNDPW